jgi:hypothetical protein
MKFKNGGFIYKEIYKKGFAGDWPFRTDSAIIACKEKTFCLVGLSGDFYALNGISSKKYDLKTPYIHPGKSIQPILKMAKDLKE